MTHGERDVGIGEAILLWLALSAGIAAALWLLFGATGCGTTGKDAMHAGAKLGADIGRKALDGPCVPGTWTRAKCDVVLSCGLRLGESAAHDGISGKWTAHTDKALERCVTAALEYRRVTQ